MPEQPHTSPNNGGGDRLDHIAGELNTTKIIAGKAAAHAALAQKAADNAREATRDLAAAVRELATEQGNILATVTKIDLAIGRWPAHPDDTGAGLLGAAARGSFTNEAAVPREGPLGSPRPGTLPPAVKSALERYKRPVAIVAAVLSILGAIAQAMQGF